MGGYNGGEIASSLAVQSVIIYVKEHFSSIQLNKESILALLNRLLNMLIKLCIINQEHFRNYQKWEQL